MVFGQVVIGPPGSGKTTYCDGMQQFLRGLGRTVAVINLDPANDVLPYEPAADIRDLISLEHAAAQCELGPNGALIYCLEYLEANVDWLLEQLASCSDAYVLFDLPGQVELYPHHGSVRTVLHALAKANHRLTAVHLVDAHHCADPAKFISVLLVTLSTMVQLEMPQVRSAMPRAQKNTRRVLRPPPLVPLLLMMPLLLRASPPTRVHLLSKVDPTLTCPHR